jgi:hypothetical protein
MEIWGGDTDCEAVASFTALACGSALKKCRVQNWLE